MISVLFLTKNLGGIDILKDNLDRQTYKDWELIIGDELKDKRWREVLDLFHGYPIAYIQPRPKKKGEVRNLNSAYNELIDLAKGELCIFLQDYILIPDDAFQKMWDWYEIYGDEAIFCVGGYGAEKPTWKEYQEGCLKPYQFTKQSVENDRSGVEKINFWDYEINFASFPTKPLKNIKFCAMMDKWYGGDNRILAYNAHKQGIKIFIDYDIKKIGFPEYFKRPKDFEKKHINKLGELLPFNSIIQV